MGMIWCRYLRSGVSGRGPSSNGFQIRKLGAPSALGIRRLLCVFSGGSVEKSGGGSAANLDQPQNLSRKASSYAQRSTEGLLPTIPHGTWRWGLEMGAGDRVLHTPHTAAYPRVLRCSLLVEIGKSRLTQGMSTRAPELNYLDLHAEPNYLGMGVNLGRDRGSSFRSSCGRGAAVRAHNLSLCIRTWPETTRGASTKVEDEQEPWVGLE